MIGGSAFPPIGQLTYLLTLPPYGFYWFSSCPTQSGAAWHRPAPEQLPEFTTLVLREQPRGSSSASGWRRRSLQGDPAAYLPTAPLVRRRRTRASTGPGSPMRCRSPSVARS